ncbi:MAG: arsenic efflux protein [Firmicutes bacterium]|nr:arsenic efflux protein [Bacillota bacterium]
MEVLIHSLEHGIKDTLTLIPFLLVTYLIMESVERADNGRAAKAVSKAGPFGPLLGALFGAFPQCGFSAAAANFYAAGLVKLGTLIAVFMSTSDEMLPIFIAEKVAATSIAKIIIVKIVIALIFGYIIHFLSGRFFKKQQSALAEYREEHGHDCSEDGHGIIEEVLIRTGKTLAIVLVITVILEFVLDTVGEDILKSVMMDVPVLGEALAGLVGLIPNCAASILITELYVSGVIGSGAMMSGLLVSAGVGLLVLFKENKNVKENIMIIAVLYVLSLLAGLVISWTGISFI